MIAETKALSGTGAMFDNQNYQNPAHLCADSWLLGTIFMSKNILYYMSENTTHGPSFLF